MSDSLKVKGAGRQADFASRDLFPAEDCNIIIPYLPSGYEDYANTGFVDGQYQIDNYLTYKRIYTGNDCFIVTWKGSTWINEELDANGQITTSWQCGEYILGFNTGSWSDTSIEQDASFAEYKKMISRNTLTFRIDANKFKLTENYKYMFYKVPEVTGDILLRVVSLESEYIGRKLIAYTLTLMSLQQDLENTGQARTQNVMSSAPGQGYYDPKIYDAVNGTENDKQVITTFKEDQNHIKVDKDRWITYDPSKFVNDPVKKVVLKLFGNAVLCNFSMIGRRANALGNMTEYSVPRWIFPINLSQASTPTLYRAQNPEDNFYFITSISPYILFTKEVLDFLKDLFSVTAKWDSEGIIYFPENYTFSNPQSNGVYSWTLYGSFDYSNDVKVETKNWQFALPSDLAVYKWTTEGTTGCATSYTITRGQTRIIHDYFWDAFWVMKRITQLPLTSKNTLSYGSLIGSGLSTIAGGIGVGLLTGSLALGALGVIAGFAIFIIGISIALATRMSTPNLKSGIMGIVSAPLLDMMTNETQTTIGSPKDLGDGVEYVWLNYFMGQGENDYLTFFKTTTMQTSFEAELTDTFKKDNKEYTTELLGQSEYEDGTQILSDGSTLLASGGETLVEMVSDDGFIIDAFNLQAIFSGDFSVEFLNADGNVIWYGVYMSSGKWTGSIRALNTYKSTSIYNRENTFLAEPKPWPKQIVTEIFQFVSADVEKTVKKTVDFGYTSTNAYNLYDWLIEKGFSSTSSLINTNPTQDADNSFLVSRTLSKVTLKYKTEGNSTTYYDVYLQSRIVNPVLLKGTFTRTIEELTHSKGKVLEYLLMLSSGNVTPENFFESFSKVSIYVDDVAIDIFKADALDSYNVYQDTSTGYWIVENTKDGTERYQYSTLGSFPITDCESGCDVQKQSSTTIPWNNAYLWFANLSGSYTQWGTTYKTYAIYDSELLEGTVKAKKAQTITAQLIFKNDGIYLAITKFDVSMTIGWSPNEWTNTTHNHNMRVLSQTPVPTFNSVANNSSAKNLRIGTLNRHRYYMDSTFYYNATNSTTNSKQYSVTFSFTINKIVCTKA